MTLRPAISALLLLATLCAASGSMPDWWRGDPLDSDGDGIPDEFERWSGLDAFDPADAASDRDGDGLTALEEFLGRTDPCSADTDGDYIPDGWEAANRPWADPAVFDADSDLDGDGLSLWHEWYFGSNPGNPDSNDDGRTDGEVFEAGGNPALDPAGDEAYGAVGFTVRIEGRAAARRAAVRIGPILHTGSRARRYRLPATMHAIELLDLDPASPEACAGRIVLTNDFTARLTLVRHTPADPHVDGRIVCDRVPGHSKVLMLAGFQDSVPFRWVGDAAEGGNVSWTLRPAGQLKPSPWFQLQGNNARNISVLGSPDLPARATLSARTTVVLPNGKRKTLKDAIEIVTLEIAAEPITNEAGTSGDAAAVANPSGLAVGSNATFRISYSPAQALAAGDIQWFPLEGKVSILGNQGASVRVQGATAGDETLQVDIPGFAGPPPQFRLKVFPQVDVVPVRVIIVRNNNGTVWAIQPAEAAARIAEANRIFAQACMRFQITDVSYTNKTDWLTIDNDDED